MDSLCKPLPRWLFQLEAVSKSIKHAQRGASQIFPPTHQLHTTSKDVIIHTGMQSSFLGCRATKHPCLSIPRRSVTHDRFNPESVELAPAARFSLPDPEFDWDYLCNPENLQKIKQNIKDRKGVGDLDKVVHLWKQVNNPDDVEVDSFYQEREKDLAKLKKELRREALIIPNRTHPDVPIGGEESSRLIETVGNKREYDFEPRTASEIGEQLGLLRTKDVGYTTGQKSYYLIGDLARLEQVLIRYTVDQLLAKRFLFYSVPDMVRSGVIEGCGFKVSGERTQVYKLDPDKHDDACLAGTGEMPLAGYYMNKMIELEKLPRRAACVSRCYRAETSDLEEEKGLYRVHQFHKVEMFGLTASDTGKESEDLMMELVDIQKSLFENLGFHFRVLDMASQELGPPAYRKFDIETWMPAKGFWGEISSTSNCLDFQSRRLNMKYWTSEGKLRHMHTVNGTACAIPRMIMAIMENYQNQDGTVTIPEVLQPYFSGQSTIEKLDKPINVKFTKFTKSLKKQIQNQY